MSEETEKKAVTEQEVGTPDVIETQKSEATEPKTGSKEYNFRKLEEKVKEAEAHRESERQQKEELEKKLKSLISPEPEKEEVQLSDDDLPEWGQVKKGTKQIVEEAIKEFQEKSERTKLPQQARAKYSDFDEVVNTETVKKLEQEHPEIAAGLISSSDPYSATYKIIKKFYTPEDKRTPEQKEEIENLEKNANGSRSINSGSSLKTANTFAKKSKKELYQEMMRCASRA